MLAVDKKADTLGVSVHWLKTGFMEEVKAGTGFDAASTTVYDIEPTVIRGKGKHITCPVDGRQGTSYVHALLASNNKHATGPANFMLSFTWKYKITDIVDTMVDYCDSHKLNPKTTFVWMCCLSVNQHRHCKTIPLEEFRDLFYGRITGINHVLVMMAPWQQPLYLTRIWRIFELYTTAHQTEDCILTILMPPNKEKDPVKQTFCVRMKHVEPFYRTLLASTTKRQQAHAGVVVESDRLEILQLVVQDEEGVKDPDSIRLHQKANGLVGAWLVQLLTSWADEMKHSQSNQAATIFSELGCVLYYQGNYASALVEYRKALTIQEAVLGKDHFNTTTVYNNICIILKLQGKHHDDSLLQ